MSASLANLTRPQLVARREMLGDAMSALTVQADMTRGPVYGCMDAMLAEYDAIDAALKSREAAEREAERQRLFAEVLVGPWATTRGATR